MLIISMPLYVELPRKTKKNRKMSIGLNQYRNRHHRISNDIKKQYKEEVKKRLKTKKSWDRVEVKLIYFNKTKRRSDLDNQVIHVKFFLDSLVELGYIEDDDYTHIPKITLEYGGQDKENPRVDFYIKETNGNTPRNISES